MKPAYHDLVEVLRVQIQALKDIINAANNGDPYDAEELATSFQADYALGYETLTRLGISEIC